MCESCKLKESFIKLFAGGVLPAAIKHLECWLKCARLQTSGTRPGPGEKGQLQGDCTLFRAGYDALPPAVPCWSTEHRADHPWSTYTLKHLQLHRRMGMTTNPPSSSCTQLCPL